MLLTSRQIQPRQGHLTSLKWNISPDRDTSSGCIYSISVKPSMATEVKLNVYTAAHSCVLGWQRTCGEGGLPRRQRPQPPQHPGCHHSTLLILLEMHTHTYKGVASLLLTQTYT